MELPAFTEKILADEDQLRRLITDAWCCAVKLNSEMRDGGTCSPRAEYETLVEHFDGVAGLKDRRDA